MAGPIEHSMEMEEAGPLWQQRISNQGVSLVCQQTIPPASTGSAELRVPIYVSAEPATQVSTSEMLVVRDADGRAVATEMICVFGPPVFPAEFHSLLEPDMLEHFQQWRVMFRLAEVSDDAA